MAGQGAGAKAVYSQPHLACARLGVSDSESWSLTRLETLGCYSPPCCAQGASDLLRSLQLLVTDRKFSPQPLAVISRSEIPMWEILPCALPIPLPRAESLYYWQLARLHIVQMFNWSVPPFKPLLLGCNCHREWMEVTHTLQVRIPAGHMLCDFRGISRWDSSSK